MRLPTLNISLLLLVTIITAQEYPNPFLETENFTPDVQFRQYVCDRQQQLDMGEIESLALALEGIELRVLLGIGSYFQLDSDGKIDEEYPGLMAVLLDEVASRGRFTWRNTFQTLEILEGETWADLLVWSAQTYDLSANWWDRTPERVSRGISYPESWYDGSLIMVGSETNEEQEEEEQLTVFSWLLPFENSVWALTVATFVFSGLVYVFLEFVDPYSDKRNLRKKPVEAMFMSAMGFAGHMELEPQTHPARLFTFSLALWALLMGAAYTANLASFLVADKRSSNKTPITTIEKLMQNGEPVCVYGGTASEERLRKDFPKQDFPNSKIISKTAEADSYQAVLDGECRAVLAYQASWQSFERNATINENCDLFHVGRNYANGVSGFATFSDSGSLCTSLVGDVVNLHMLSMKHDGFIAKAWEEYLERSATNACSSSSTATRQQRRSLKSSLKASTGSILESSSSDADRLSINNMGGIFIMHGGLSCIAVIAALVHRWLGMTQRRNKERWENCLRRQLQKQEFKKKFTMARTPIEKQKTLRALMKYQGDESNSGWDNHDEALTEEDAGIQTSHFFEDKIDALQSTQERQVESVDEVRQEIKEMKEQMMTMMTLMNHMASSKQQCY